MPEPVPGVRRCPPSDRPLALRKLHEGLSAQKQAELVAALQEAPLDDEAYWDGLLIAGPRLARAAVAWLQPAAGKTGVLWPPPSDAPQAAALFRAVAATAALQSLSLVQLLLADGEPRNKVGLAAGGFGELAKLAYMAAPSRPATGLADCEFESFAGEQPDRLARLIEQTYRGTLDCPQLDGMRTIADVLSGYRAQGKYLPGQWYFLRRESRDVGVLLMASHPAAGNWELVYMGLVPAARGEGLGRQIVEFALNAANCGGAQQVVLAVDAANNPAIQVYEAAGFRNWDRRTVYAWLQRPEIRPPTQ